MTSMRALAQAVWDVLQKALEIPRAWTVLGISLGLTAAALLPQYAILRHRNLPPTDLGLPFLGHTLTFFRDGFDAWSLMLKGKVERSSGSKFTAALTNLNFKSVVVMTHELYSRHVNSLDRAGHLVGGFPSSVFKLLGRNSVLLLPASTSGKATPQHRRIRAKILRAMAPVQVLSHAEAIEELADGFLAGLVAATESQGFGVVDKAAAKFAMAATIRLIVGEEKGKHLEGVGVFFESFTGGLLAPPIDLGSFTQHGRAMQARRAIVPLLEDILKLPATRRTALGELVLAGEEGEPLEIDEIVDTVLTLLFAGQFTTKDAIAHLFVDLQEHPEEIPRIAAEADLPLTSVERDSRTLHVIKESLRLHPPARSLRRCCPASDIDLGGSGVVPSGCPMAVLLHDVDRAWNPSRWEGGGGPELIVFGGNQPHSCVGRTLAMLELQIVLRKLCRNYTFKIPEVVVTSTMGIVSFKDGLKVSMATKSQSATPKHGRNCVAGSREPGFTDHNSLVWASAPRTVQAQ